MDGRSASRSEIARGLTWVSLALPLAMSGCNRPHPIDPDAAAYCEKQGLPRATTGNFDCAQKRVEELTDKGEAPPDPGDPIPVHPETLPSTGRVGGVSQIVEVMVKPGVKTTLHFAFAVKPDCKAAGLPILQMTTRPEHGTATTAQRVDYARNASGGRPTMCDGHKVAGVALDYASDKAYLGPDWLEFDTISPEGILTHFKVPIDVENPEDDDD